ncbi:MAG: hypothetical protein RSF82_06955 [Angelakisella sp.]
MYILCSLLFMYGAYLFYSGSTYSVSAACSNAVAKDKVYNLSGRYDRFIQNIAIRLQPFIKVSEQKQRLYGKLLQAAKDKRKPTIFVASLVAKSGIWIVVGLLLLPRSVAATITCWAYGVYLSYAEVSAIKEGYQRYQTAVEMDLPKLCSVINSRLNSTTNVQAILTSFLPIASPSMQEEIMLTLSDMKTGNQVVALMRMETRLSSPKVSDVVRGLISVLNGDDQTLYFQAKQHQFNNDYLAARRKEIQQRPLKLTMPGMVAFFFFFLMVVYPLVIIITTSMNGIF